MADVCPDAAAASFRIPTLSMLRLSTAAAVSALDLSLLASSTWWYGGFSSTLVGTRHPKALLLLLPCFPSHSNALHHKDSERCIAPLH